MIRSTPPWKRTGLNCTRMDEPPRATEKTCLVSEEQAGETYAKKRNGMELYGKAVELNSDL